MTYYTLRYLPEVPLAERKHEHTLGQWPTFEHADDERLRTPVPPTYWRS